jgi:hypothetical protein
MSAFPRQSLTLFSTVTSLAYWVAERFYGHCHHVWCAPAPAMDRFVPRNPPSSDPIQIYWSFHEDSLEVTSTAPRSQPIVSASSEVRRPVPLRGWWMK